MEKDGFARAGAGAFRTPARRLTGTHHAEEPAPRPHCTPAASARAPHPRPRPARVSAHVGNPACTAPHSSATPLAVNGPTPHALASPENAACRRPSALEPCRHAELPTQ